jgi:glycine/D-amino acid oxidase-like deaminating enzyme
MEARKLAMASENAIGDVIEFCRAHSIDAQIRQDGWLWAATSPAQMGLWSETIDALAANNAHPMVAWSNEEINARSGSAAHIAGVFDSKAAQVQPALLARGLRRVVMAHGVRIYENTPLSSISLKNPAIVRTPDASVKAEKVVLAMNAWATRWASIRKAVTVVSGDIIMTDPVPDELERIGWKDGLGISDGRALIHYYRTTPEGRIAFGKGGMSGRFCFGGHVGKAVEGASELDKILSGYLHNLYPSLPKTDQPTSWRGPVDRTQSGLPIFWHMGGYKNVFFGVGFSGNGIGPSYLAGKILSALALEQKNEWSQCALVREPSRDFPPEPFRYMGSSLIRKALQDKDQADDTSRNPSLYSRLFARMAPAGVSPFKAEAKVPGEHTSVPLEP